MPKRKVKSSINNSQKIIAALFRVRKLHSPCISEKCPIDYQHCTGCNESFPCQTIHALEGTKPINETITLYGDQFTGDPEQDAKAEVVYTEVKEIEKEENKEE
jgi:hypothetical protein